ncbi:MAG: hypothetical protein MRERV_25c005 [Mycoplasmataceae bacterium RV_VA103A]|nr:MAG: hypothetical protein MRERV_25c005 [Mycoplasmataceae bacterium RV_VA103A]
MTDLITALNNENGTKTRKRKFDPDKMWAKCRVCGETGNIENMLWQKVAFANGNGQVLFGCYEGVYFCSDSCQERFSA